MARRTKTTAILGFMAVAVAVAAFAATYVLRDDDPTSRADEPPAGPDRSITPEPGATPDTTQPFWHIPYVNQDREKPTFVGELNGFTIDPAMEGRSPYEICPGQGLHPPRPGEEFAAVVAEGPLQIDPAELPEGTEPHGPPSSFFCGEDVATVVWVFRVRAGTPGVDEGGTLLEVARVRGMERVNHSAPGERWAAATIVGERAVVSKPVIAVGGKVVGSCYVAVYQPETDVMTSVLALSASEEFCISVAETMLR